MVIPERPMVTHIPEIPMVIAMVPKREATLIPLARVLDLLRRRDRSTGHPEQVPKSRALLPPFAFCAFLLLRHGHPQLKLPLPLASLLLEPLSPEQRLMTPFDSVLFYSRIRCLPMA
jgi:hypothetical protein